MFALNFDSQPQKLQLKVHLEFQVQSTLKFFGCLSHPVVPSPPQSPGPFKAQPQKSQVEAQLKAQA